MDHKEILTDEHIRNDLRRMAPVWRVVLASFSVLLSLGILIACSIMYYIGPPFLTVVLSGFLFLVTLKVTIDELIRFFRYRPIAVSGHYTVTVDRMTHLEKNTYLFSYTKRQPRVCFAKHAPFYAMHLNRFSLQVERWHINAFSNAREGDTFYIVTTDGKTPLMVYNTKLFEYNGDKKAE